jgi:hypothetical protein
VFGFFPKKTAVFLIDPIIRKLKTKRAIRCREFCQGIFRK